MIAGRALIVDSTAMTLNDGSALALRALAYMAERPEIMAHFCGATGIAPADLRAGLGDVDLHAGILDFLLLDDAWVCDFAATAGIAPEAVMRARAALPGGPAAHWT